MSCWERLVATRRDVEAKHEVEPEQIVEQLSIATSFLLGTEASAGRAHMGGQDRILVDVHVSSFVDLGLERRWRPGLWISGKLHVRGRLRDLIDDTLFERLYNHQMQ